MLPWVGPRWSTADHPRPKRGFDAPEQLTQRERFPWERDEEEDGKEGKQVGRKKKVKPLN